MDLLAITQKLKAEKGDVVCMTQIKGINDIHIKSGDQFAGELEESLTEGACIKLKPIKGSREIKTTLVCSLIVSFNSILVQTENSLYLLEKIPQ